MELNIKSFLILILLSLAELKADEDRVDTSHTNVPKLSLSEPRTSGDGGKSLLHDKDQLGDDGDELDQPNIIVIMVDDLGWNDVGFHDSEIKTPNIDRLARQGVILDNYYTAPNCGPSRSQFVTGKYLTHLGLQHKNLQPCRPNGVPLKEKTIADELKDLGYTNHMIGKWHAGFYTESHLPTNRGFDTFLGILNGQGDHFKHTRGYKGGKYLDFYNDTTPTNDYFNQYSTDVYTNRALDLIQEHNETGDPMFMWLSYQAPHTPNQAPEEYIRLYDNITSRDRRVYAAMVTALDDAVKEIVDKLKDTNMYENTVIVFTSDNGGQAFTGSSNYPLRGNKGTFYEAGIRAVGFVSSPLIKRRGVSTALVHVTDWKPTFMHLAGGESRGLDGVNQWNTLTKGFRNRRTEILYNIDPLELSPIPKAEVLKLPETKEEISQPGNNKPVNIPSPEKLREIAEMAEPAKCRNCRKVKPRGRSRRRKNKRRNRGGRRRRPRDIQLEVFDARQLSAIRSGDWKLLTGTHGFSGIVPNPVTDIAGFSNASKRSQTTRPLVQLYNLKDDPTESRDLSRERPEVVELLMIKLQKYQRTALEPYYPPRSEACDPQLNGGAWGPYVK